MASRWLRVLIGVLVVWLLVGASCDDRVLGVQIEGGDVTLAVGETRLLRASVATIGKATRDLTWSSVNEQRRLRQPSRDLRRSRHRHRRQCGCHRGAGGAGARR